MFSDSVSYTDFNDNDQISHMYFNITKAEMYTRLDLIARVEKMEQIIRGAERELTVPEVQEILHIVQAFMELAYGEKTPDGKGFVKSKEVWDNFRWSLAYDEYLTTLFEDPAKAFGFIFNVLPKDARENLTPEIRQQLSEHGVSINGQTGEATPAPAPEPQSEPKDTRPQWLIEGRPPTADEFRAATDEEKIAAFELKSKA